MSLLNKTAQLALLEGTGSPLGSSLVPILRQARDFTKTEWESHLKKHPKADKSKHTITDSGGGSKKDKGEAKSKDKGKSKEEVHKEVKDKNIDVKPPIGEDELVEFAGELPGYHIEIIAGGEGGEITEADLRRARAIKAQLSRGIQAAADVCKMSPPVCQGNLGVSRSSMPQLMDKPVSELLGAMPEGEYGDLKKVVAAGGGKLSAITNKKKREAFLERRKGLAAVDAGANPNDNRSVFQQTLDALTEEGTGVSSQSPPYDKRRVGELKATQREIKAGKTFGIANAYLSGDYDPRKAPIIISSDNHILDGHHRYSAMVTADPDAKMNVIIVDMPMKDFLKRAFEQPGVFRADIQDNIVPKDSPLELGSASSKDDKKDDAKDDKKGKKASLRTSAIWLAANNPGTLEAALLPLING